MIDVVLDASKVRKRAEEEEKEVAAKATTSSVVLAWRDLTVSVSSSQGGQARKVLHGLTGYAEPGRLLAVMGPSGSGKSTLLDSLAGRLARNAKREGSVWINGQKQKTSFGTAAYVTQEDVLIGTLTVRETIFYSAKLRLPDKMPLAEKIAMVETAILEMGLSECADTVIGNWHLRGLSGGEKRRVSIALELLLRPHLLFLDEPTSGLDSASAFFVTKTLQKLARDGRTVLASIHQPSSEVFALFDDLFLLANGRTVYFGESRSAHQYFSAAGFPCPPLRNPSDHFLRAINSDFDRVKQTLKGSYIDDQLDSSDPLNKITATEVVAILLDSYPLSTQAFWADSKVNEYTSLNGTVSEPNGSQASFLTQSLTLTCRSFVNMTRDIGYYWLRLAIYMLLTLCIGTIYFKVGSTYESIAARASCMAYVAGFLTFMSIGGFPSFVEDMKVFARERLNGHYGVAAFVIANTLSSLPFLFLICFVSGFICYYMVGLNPGFDHFIYFLLILFCSVSVVESLMMAVASVVPNFLMGIITGAGIQGFFMLVAGFFRLPNEIPKVFWKYPVSYLSFHMFSLQGMYQNDFLGVDFSNKFPALPTIPGRLILSEFYQVNMRRSKWANLAVVFSMIVIYRLFFFAMIKAGEDLWPRARRLTTSRASLWRIKAMDLVTKLSEMRRKSSSIAHRSSSDEFLPPPSLL
ncbi:ATP-binding cassette transporter [Selaginella moellendorffii]|uniref:ATP-binding cassette transporter n=2 Tax=Selaginella moellendorffii TaxID=88036 RepID=D8R908_SELML|nr:ATP-binding cassette transporter [Selaginella moellendorffii]